MQVELSYEEYIETMKCCWIFAGLEDAQAWVVSIFSYRVWGPDKRELVHMNQVCMEQVETLDMVCIVLCNLHPEDVGWRDIDFHGMVWAVHCDLALDKSRSQAYIQQLNEDQVEHHKVHFSIGCLY